jgi:hypothetical protein
MCDCSDEQKPKNELMKTVGLGKRQSFPTETSQPLAQGVEPALGVGGLTAVFADRLVPVCREH